MGASPKQHRVLRGGSFNNHQNNVRCAARNRNNPDNRNRNNGARLVVSTLFYPVVISRRALCAEKSRTLGAEISRSARNDKWKPELRGGIKPVASRREKRRGMFPSALAQSAEPDIYQRARALGASLARATS
ncbi:MAG: hypothetical protein FJ009_19410 [Chloroflexi bacterium]|nr:hypothetical protein [Chloroflexota bacterium]